MGLGKEKKYSIFYHEVAEIGGGFCSGNDNVAEIVEGI